MLLLPAASTFHNAHFHIVIHCFYFTVIAFYRAIADYYFISVIYNFANTHRLMVTQFIADAISATAISSPEACFMSRFVYRLSVIARDAMAVAVFLHHFPRMLSPPRALSSLSPFPRQPYHEAIAESSFTCLSRLLHLAPLLSSDFAYWLIFRHFSRRHCWPLAQLSLPHQRSRLIPPIRWSPSPLKHCDWLARDTFNAVFSYLFRFIDIWPFIFVYLYRYRDNMEPVMAISVFRSFWLLMRAGDALFADSDPFVLRQVADARRFPPT
jgi:hypothetical protein